MIKRFLKILMRGASNDVVDQYCPQQQMPFPNQVNVQPAPAVEGDWASTNPRNMVLAGPGGLVAGTGPGGQAGVAVGRWVWLSDQYIDADNAPGVVNQFAATPAPGSQLQSVPAGIIHREQQGLIMTYLTEFSLLVPTGFPITVTNSADIWVKNRGANIAQPGMYAFANFADGSTQFGAGGTVGTTYLNGFTCTGSIGPESVAFTGSISGNILTVSGTLTGLGSLVPGASLSGGTGVQSGTVIVQQLTGVTGSAGTYALNIPQQQVAAALLTATFGLLTVSGTLGGTIGVGDILSGAGGTSLTTGTYITALGTGTGGTGTYYVNATQTASSTLITSQTNVQTKWFAASQGKTGELVKISTHLLG